jgi:glutathione S-transferase
MLRLVIGNKNYSSWSLRPWLVLKQAGVPFEETRLDIYRPNARAEILKHSPTGKVPCLFDGDLQVWDSLAICEYLAEAQRDLWPADRAARARARSVSAEMHSGFAALRSKMSMDICGAKAGQGRTPESEADIARIVDIWEGCRARPASAGAFLFGPFSIADALFAPVVWRFETYAVALPPAARSYADAMLALPAMKEWAAAARAEIG